MSEWKKIKSAPEGTSESNPVDLWLVIGASPRSFGMGDRFRVVDCWRENGNWVHRHEGKVAELVADYITHWMRPPEPPK